MNLKISLTVTVVHLFLVAGSLYLQPIALKKNVPRKILVRTISSPPILDKPQQAPLSVATIPQKKLELQRKEEARETAKVPVHKKAVLQTQKQKGAIAHKEDLIALMTKSLDTIDSSLNQHNPIVLKNLKQLPLSSESLFFEMNYQEKLTAHLQHLLTLPEKGDVKIKLSLKRNGRLEGLEILAFSKVSNRDYVKNTLPTLTFPPFGSQFKGENVHSFSITLTSED